VVLAPSLMNLDCLAPGVRERVGGTCSVLTRVGGRADVLHYAAYDASNGTVVVGAVHSLNASQAAITSQATAGRLAAPSPPFAGDRDIATPSSPPLSPPPSPTLPSPPSPGVPPVLVSAAAGPDALSLASDTSPLPSIATLPPSAPPSVPITTPPPSVPITTPPPSVPITTPPPVVIALRDEDVLNMFSDDGKTDASETEEEEAAEKDSASSMLRVCVVPLLTVVAASFALSS
jgi:hypothetical protein